MGAQEVDRLEVAVKANAQSANQQLDTLINRLTAVNSALRSVNSGGLQGLSNSVRNFSSSMQSMKSVGTADFTRLTKNIQKLTTIDTASLNRTASSMNIIGKSLNNLSTVSANAIQIGEIAKNIAKLGSASVNRAILNMPLLAKSLNEMITSLSKAPMVSQNLIQMTNALANLSSKGSKVGSSVSSMNRYLNNTANASGRAGRLMSLFSGNTDRARRSSRGLASTIGLLYAKFWMLIRGLKSVGNAIKSAMDFIETVDYYGTIANKIGSEFGDQYEKYGYDSANAYANSFNNRMQQLTGKMTGYTFDMDGNTTSTGMKSLNLDVNAMTDYQASVMAVTNSLGLCGETSINTAKAFSMLAADESSLRNVDLSTVMTNLTSGLIGQSRALYKYGIDITNNTLQQYAYANGIQKSVSAMTQSEKMQLRLLAILDQSRVAWGNMADTLNTPANQLRVLKQNFTNLARVIGNLFMPIVSMVLPYINALVIALQRLFTWVARIFGIDLSGISAGMGSMDDAYADLVDDADDYTGAVDNANKATKKLQNTIMGFDEINKMNDNTDTSGSGSGSGGAGGSGIDLSDQIASALDDYEKVWNQAFNNMENKANAMADKICDAFKRHDYTGIGKYIGDGISDALERIPWKNVYSVAKNFGTGFAEFLNGLISPRLFGDVAKTIAGCLNTAIYTSLAFGETFDWGNLGNSIAYGINDFFETFDFSALGKSVNTWVQGVKKTLITTIKKVKWSDVMEGIADFLSELDISTVAILIGAFALKHGGKALTAQLLKEVVLGKLTALTATSGFSPLSATLEIALILLISSAAIKYGPKIEKGAVTSLMKKIFGMSDEEADEKFETEYNLTPKDGKIIDGNGNVKGNYQTGLDWIKEKLGLSTTGSSHSSARGGNHGGGSISFDVELNNNAEKDANKIKTNTQNELSKTGSLQTTAKSTTTGNQIYNGLEDQFRRNTLYTGSRTTTNGMTIYNGLQNQFGKRYLYTGSKTTTNGSTIYNGLQSQFSKKDLTTTASISTTPATLWNDFLSGWKRVVTPLNLHVEYTKATGIKGGIVSALGLQGWPSLKFYANGGFPGLGDVFVANENGPEMVGRMGGRNTVANNIQIVDGIKQGVTEAMMEVVMASSSGNEQKTKVEIPIYLDGREIARGTYENIQEMIRCGFLKPIL